MIENTEIQNKVAFVTGGSSGIGFETAKKLLQGGAKVAFCGRNEDKLRKSEIHLREISHDVFAFTADISNFPSIESGVSEINRRFGPIDILINNAGIYQPNSIVDIAYDEWETQFAINLKGAFLVTKAVTPQMIERKSGRIIFVSSNIAIITPPQNSCYAATKWGLEGFVGCIAQELCEHGILVNIVRPGMTDTGIFDEIGKPDWDIDWIDPAEIAATIDFLCRLPSHAQVPEITYTNTFQRYDY